LAVEADLAGEKITIASLCPSKELSASLTYCVLVQQLYWLVATIEVCLGSVKSVPHRSVTELRWRTWSLSEVSVLGWWLLGKAGPAKLVNFCASVAAAGTPTFLGWLSE
jgi:hypothetical protein